MHMRVEHLDRMTSDGGPPPNGKDGDVLQTLTRVAIARTLAAAELGRSPDREVHASLVIACDVARQRGLEAEGLVKIVKESWHHLADDRPLERRVADRALDRADHDVHR